MAQYTDSFLSMRIGPLAALSILTCALYTVSPEMVKTHGTDKLMSPVPFVPYGVLRWLYLVYRRSEGGDPGSLLFRDAPRLVSGVGYAALVVVVLRAAGVHG